MSDASLAEVADRLAINELMYRYARMVDFRKWELFDQVFTADATCDYTSTGGIKGSAREVTSNALDSPKARPLTDHSTSPLGQIPARCNSSTCSPLPRTSKVTSGILARSSTAILANRSGPFCDVSRPRNNTRRISGRPYSAGEIASRESVLGAISILSTGT